MSDVWERISGDEARDGPEWRLHAMRYRIAAGFVAPGDRVVDAACGTGYGRQILGGEAITYIGVDRALGTEVPVGMQAMVRANWFSSDLEQPWPHHFPFDVWVGLETVEHLHDPRNYLAAARLANRHIILSVPIVATTSFNPHHARDYGPDDLPAMVCDDEWELLDWVSQGGVYGIYAFRRTGR